MLKKVIPIILFCFAAFTGWFYFWGGGIAFEVNNSEIITFKESSSRSSDTISIVTYNVGYFSGMTNNLAVDRNEALFQKNMAEFHTLMERINPDILALQEVDFKSDRSYSVNQFLEMGTSEQFNYGATSINWNKRYVPFPYFSPTTHFGRILSGQGVLSRFKVNKNDRLVLKQPIEASFIYKKFYLDRLAQFVEIEINDKTVTVINVHLEAFDDDTREVQAKQIVAEIRKRLSGKPYILIGDFNTVPLYTPDKKYVSDEENNFVTEKTMKIFRDSLNIAAAYSDEYALKDLRSTYTFPSDEPQQKIDHIFYTPEYIEPLEKFTIQENSTLSDHLPVGLKFKLK